MLHSWICLESSSSRSAAVWSGFPLPPTRVRSLSTSLGHCYGYCLNRAEGVCSLKTVAINGRAHSSLIFLLTNRLAMEHSTLKLTFTPTDTVLSTHPAFIYQHAHTHLHRVGMARSCFSSLAQKHLTNVCYFITCSLSGNSLKIFVIYHVVLNLCGIITSVEHTIF